MMESSLIGDGAKSIDISANLTDTESDGIQAMRIKLAVMKAKDDETKPELLEAIEMVDADLQSIEELENFKPVPGIKVSVTKKAKEVSSEFEDQILQSLNGITKLHIKIFEALLVKVKTRNAYKEETPHSRRKLKDFETRFQRQFFEAKQKILCMEGAKAKLKLNPSEKSRLTKFKQSLVQVSRNFTLLYESYVHYLPFCTLTFFPQPMSGVVEKTNSFAIDLLVSVSIFTFSKRSDLKEAANQIKDDSERLQGVLFRIEEKNEKSPKVGKKVFQNEQLSLINSLAKEKFGSQKDQASPKKSNLKRAQMLKKREIKDAVVVKPKPKIMQEIIPRQNKVQTERAKISHLRRKSEDMPSFNHRNFIGLSEEDKMKQLAFQGHEDDTNQSLSLISFDEKPVVGAESPSIKGVLPPMPEVEIPMGGPARNRRKLLDLRTDEVNEILRFRSNDANGKNVFPSSFDGQKLITMTGENPMLLVSAICDNIVKEVIQETCGEILSADLVSKLIHLEFV